mgnify:CR=1 FL=1
MIVRPGRGGPSLGEEEPIAVRERGGRGREAVGGGFDKAPAVVGWNREGRFAVCGRIGLKRRDAAGRVHAIAFFRKKYRMKCGF